MTRSNPTPNPAEQGGLRFSRSLYAFGWLPLLLTLEPPGFYVIAMAVLGVMFGLVAFAHAIIGLLRNWRRFRDGH